VTWHEIRVSGCDDSTSIRCKLSESEAATVRAVAEAITEASTYGCMPTMDVNVVDNNYPTERAA